jgi:hypothetical protein
MAKPALEKAGLGRGLGQLMNGQDVAGRSPLEKPAANEDQTIKVEFGRGLTSLVSTQAPPHEEPKKILIPAWFFFAADILLLAFAVVICFDAPQPFDLGALIFSLATVTCAGILGLAGVFRVARSA